MAEIGKKYDVTELARQVEELRSDPDDSVFSRMFKRDNLHSILETCITFDKQVSNSDKPTLVEEIIRRAYEHPKVNQKVLTDCIQRTESTYLSLPLKEYVLATSLTIKYFKELKPIEIRGSKIVFLPFLPKKFDRNKLKDLIEHVKKIGFTHNFATVLVTVKARTEVSAADKALFSLEYVRGIWNYHLNLRNRISWEYGLPRKVQINNIMLGPIHTLHTSSGELASEMLWWQTENQQSDNIFNLEHSWEQLNQRFKRTRGLCSRIKYSETIETFFVRYTRAFDFWDYEIAYNKLWSLLEILVNASGKYEVLISRVLFLCHEDERKHIKLILEHLRDARNSLVHDDVYHQRARFYCYQIKWFIEMIFNFHLHYGQKFSSLEEVCEFLDLPKEPKILRDRIALYQKGLRFHKTWWPEDSGE